MFENIAVECPVGFLAAVTEALAKLPAELWRTGNDGFAGIAAAVDALSVQLDCARVGLVQEAESRGVVAESPSASSTDWLLAHSEHLEPADAARTVDVARLCALPKNQVMAAAVSGGTLTVRKAMTALRQLGQVEHALEPGKREEALASLTLMAQTGYDRHVIAVGRSLMALVGADRSLERNETALRTLSSLKLCPLANGMIAIRGQLDPESGAVLSAALDPLSAPTPCEANGGRDPRQADRRRADALVELCRRATAAGGSAPTTTKAQIVVTIGYERLAGAVRGSGTTLAGQVLSPHSVRKLACDASIIPMVLGSQGQPLDVGRTKRLVTPALLAALWARDKGCTFPGCGRPPQWTDAHHVRHWIDGGTTSLLNLALLCGYHPPPRSAGRYPHLGSSTRPHRCRHRTRLHLANLTC
ncbi:MAG: DUF222 domain-containing protein [Phycicoccus sp.]|nr:DUF222 domain-containing protein [Phycicoccus sp.]